jgi:hypothetical protein
MPAVSAAMPGPMVASLALVPASLTATCHYEAAWLAELRSLRFHARGDLRHVRNNVAAQPHRIRRASLAGRVAALGRRATDVKDNDTGQ